MKALANFGVYSLGSILQTAMTFLLLPVYIKYLTPAEYGVISILLVVSSILILVTGLGVPSGFYRLYYEEKQNELFTTAVLWQLSATLVAFFPVVVYATQISEVLFKSDQYHLAVIYMAGFVVVTSFRELSFLTLRLKQLAKPFVGYSLTLGVVSVVLKFIYIALLKQGVIGFWLAHLLAEALMTCVIFFHFRMFSFIKRPGSHLLKKMFKIGFPYMFSTIGVWAVDAAGKLFLNFFVGAGAVGVYTLAAKISSLFTAFLSKPLQLWWGPFAFEKAAREGIQSFKIISIRLLDIITVAAIVSSCLIPLSGLVIRYLPGQGEYRLAVPLVVFCTIPLLLQLLSLVFGVQFAQAKKTHYAAVGGIVASGVSVAANLLLIPLFGMAGAILSGVIAYAAWLLVYCIGAQREIHIDYNWGRVMRNMALFVVYIGLLLGTILFRNDLYFSIWPLSSLATAAAVLAANRRLVKSLLLEAGPIIKPYLTRSRR